jgi:hypothetical protein
MTKTIDPKNKLAGPLSRFKSKQKIQKISVRKLLNLSHSSLRLGPWSCQKWHSQLDEFFNYVYKSRPQVQELFPSLGALLSGKPALPDANAEEKTKTSLVLQFVGMFVNRAADKIPGNKDEIKLFALVFACLTGLAHNIRQRQAQNKPFDDLIEVENKVLAELSKNLSTRFEIVK